MTLVIKNENNRKETHWNVDTLIDTGNTIKIYYSDQIKVVEIAKNAITIEKILL